MPDETAREIPAGSDLRSEFARLARQKIKAAALRCFEQHGYRATTIRQIAKAAGTTPTTFYQYFKGKAEIMVELGHDNEPALLQIAAALDRELARPSRAGVRRWVDSYAELWGQSHAVFDAYWEALGERGVAEDLFPFAAKMSEQMPRVLDRFSGTDRERVKIRISLMFFYISQTFFVAYSTGDGARTAEILEGLTDMMWSSLALWTRGEGLGEPD